MKRIAGLVVAITMATICNGQAIGKYKVEELVQRISNTDTIYVVNFWATWCAPCVKELPEFAKIHEQYAGKPVKVLMVSLDFKEAYPKKLEGFVKKKKMPQEVIWFDETNANEFIPKIDDSWQGSIPATLVVNAAKQFKIFKEGEVTAQQLGAVIDAQLAP